MRTYLAVMTLALAAGGAGAGTVVVYGGTPAGIAAAVTAARLGHQVTLAEPSRHVGGVVSGGLTRTDIGDGTTIGGFPREFFDRCLAYYQRTYGKDSPQVKDSAGGYYMEPQVAEREFEALAGEAKVQVLRGLHVVGCRLAPDQAIAEATLADETGRQRTLSADAWVDATYEGDLMACAKVPYRVGREGRAEYGESLAGLRVGPPETIGQADRHTQAYNYRLCLTDREDLRVCPPEPRGYDRTRYRRLLASLLALKTTVLHHNVLNIERVPNGKFDANNGPSWQSTDWVGGNDDYAEADWPKRQAIARAHLQYVQGLWYFLQNDSAVPEVVRTDARRYGLARDEFVDNDHWPHQLYVRECRRMVGLAVLTERDLRSDRHKGDSIAVGSYMIDCHGVTLVPHAEREVTYEGGLGVAVRPYEIPYGVICPPTHPNLLVPVCCSTSHVAYCSLRMEPVYMMLGQAAGVAAHLALSQRRPVQRVPTDQLQALLRQQRAILDAPHYPRLSIRATPGATLTVGQTAVFEAVPDSERTVLKQCWWDFDGDGRPDAEGKRASHQFVVAGRPTVWLVGQDATGRWTNYARLTVTVGAGGTEEMLIDDEDHAQQRSAGRWQASHVRPGYYGDSYHHNDQDPTGRCAWRYLPNIAREGRYRVLLGVVSDKNRATKVPVTIYHAGGQTEVTVNQRQSPGVFPFVDLGTYQFQAGAAGSILIRTTGADGVVVVDCVRLVPVD